MLKSQLKKINLPDSPGVYFFIDNQSKVLYIGKATSLKIRVASYFTKNLSEKRSKLIENMVKEAETVEFTATESVLEAVILETNLIRTHKPKFNTRSKDDKSYNYVVITKEEWSRVLLVRERDLTEKFLLNEIDCSFGPFPSGGLLREALKIIRRLFKYYDVKTPVQIPRSKILKGQIEFNQQIGLYPNAIDEKVYQKTIKHLKLFFRGKKSLIIKDLEKEMYQLAKTQKFEEADVIKRKIFALKHIEDINLVKKETFDVLQGEVFRIEAYDVAHLAGSNMVGSMVVVDKDEPKKNEYRKFKIRGIKKANDPSALRQVLNRRFTHKEWSLPGLIVVDGNTVQQSVALEVLKKLNLSIPVVAVTKNAQHKPVRLLGTNAIINKYRFAILLANSEAHRFALNFHRQQRRIRID